LGEKEEADIHEALTHKKGYNDSGKTPQFDERERLQKKLKI